MTKTTTITINGRLYDAITGMPVRTAQPTRQQAPVSSESKVQPAIKQAKGHINDIGPAPAKPAHNNAHAQPARTTPAQHMHQRPQKSQTLYRRALAKPAPSQEQRPAAHHTRSPLISRFGSHMTTHPELSGAAQPAKQSDQKATTPAQPHPVVAKALQRAAAAPKQQPSGSEVKEQLIKERLADVSEAPKHKRKWFKSKPRMATILTTTLAILVLGGYLTYMNLPVISMQVAASRAGVDATFPSYRPDGYNLDGPITYSPGEVSINYKSTTNDSGFRVTQKQSNWDSQALLDNYVMRETENYLTFQERGITVYTFGEKAAWVNGGLLYTLGGNASLSADQVLRLATSM